MRMSSHLLYVLSLSQYHFSWLCWETVSLESHVWMRLLRRCAVLLDFHHLRVMLGRQAVGKHMESKDNSCFKWYFQKVLPRPTNPLHLGGQCCFGFHRCSHSGASSGVLSNCGWCSFTMVVKEPWLPSSSHPLGGGLGYPLAETEFPPPCVAEGWRPACWPLAQNAFSEASWNKVQRHPWQKLKLSFISICLMYLKR